MDEMDEMKRKRKIERGEFLEITGRITNPKTLVRIIHMSFNIPCVWIYCIGECLGKTDDVSSNIPNIPIIPIEGSNVCYGDGKIYPCYWRSAKIRGEEIKYNGEGWLVALNDCNSDDHYNSNHSLVIVPLSAFL